MDEDSREKLVEGYLRHAASATRSQDDETFTWAYDAMDDLVRDDPASAWPVIVALVARAADDLPLAYIAAGPLENILQAHGARIIDLVTECAQSDARMRRALTGVWGFDRLPRDVSRRLEALIEGEPRL